LAEARVHADLALAAPQLDLLTGCVQEVVDRPRSRSLRGCVGIVPLDSVANLQVHTLDATRHTAESG
jgi:hypothetical protein